MQKIFVRRFLIIMVVTVLLSVILNSAIQAYFAERTAVEAGHNTIALLQERIDNNSRVIADLTASLNENYIARAYAFAEIIAQNPDMLTDFDEMVRMTKVLHVDEVHVTDEAGILRWGNIPEYYGLDFSATDQTRPFMPCLTDKGFALAQKPQPNGSIGKLFQYVSVARQDKTGIVQVGLAPEVLDRALSNNKIDVVISNFNVSEGKGILAISRDSGLVVGDTNSAYIGMHYSELGIPAECFTLQTPSRWMTLDGEKVFSLFDEYGAYVIGVTATAQTLSADRLGQNIVAVVSSSLLGLIIIGAIFISLKRIIIYDIEAVNNKLKHIEQGDLNVVVSANSTPEFAQLSHGINEMVSSLKDHIDEIAQQSTELEAQNASILASLNYARRIQNNLLPSPEAFGALFADYSILWEPKDVVGGDIYWVKEFPDVSVLCVCDCTGHGTPGALLTMLVVSLLESIVTEDSCHDPAQILWTLDQKLIATLNSTNSFSDINDGADLALLCIRKNGDISLAAAKTHIFICDGETVHTVKGQKLSLGGGTLSGKDEIRIIHIPADPRNRYYIASDGLFDQIGGSAAIPFGYQRFKSVILENYSSSQEKIMARVWETFNNYMGEESRRDDITLLSFRLQGKEPSN